MRDECGVNGTTALLLDEGDDSRTINSLLLVRKGKKQSGIN